MISHNLQTVYFTLPISYQPYRQNQLQSVSNESKSYFPQTLQSSLKHIKSNHSDLNSLNKDIVMSYSQNVKSCKFTTGNYLKSNFFGMASSSQSVQQKWNPTHDYRKRNMQPSMFLDQFQLKQFVQSDFSKNGNSSKYPRESQLNAISKNQADFKISGDNFMSVRSKIDEEAFQLYEEIKKMIAWNKKVEIDLKKEVSRLLDKKIDNLSDNDAKNVFFSLKKHSQIQKEIQESIEKYRDQILQEHEHKFEFEKYKQIELLLKKYKFFIDDIVNQNPFVSNLFTDQLKKKIIKQAQSDISISFKNTQQMGSQILDEILIKHIDSVYDICYLMVNSHGLDANEEHYILENIEKKNEEIQTKIKNRVKNFSGYENSKNDEVFDDFGSEDDEGDEEDFQIQNDQKKEDQNIDEHKKQDDIESHVEENPFDSQNLRKQIINVLNSEPQNVTSECLDQWKRLGPFSDLDLIKKNSDNIEFDSFDYCFSKLLSQHNRTYEGQVTIQDLQKEGVGRLTLCEALYEGAFYKNEMKGYGRKIERNGNYYIGQFEFGRYYGEGTLYDQDGNVIQSGTWR